MAFKLDTEKWKCCCPALGGSSFCDFVLSFCNLPGETTQICDNCVKKWGTWLRKETPAAFAVYKTPAGALFPCALRSLCISFRFANVRFHVICMFTALSFALLLLFLLTRTGDFLKFSDACSSSSRTDTTEGLCGEDGNAGQCAPDRWLC